MKIKKCLVCICIMLLCILAGCKSAVETISQAPITSDQEKAYEYQVIDNAVKLILHYDSTVDKVVVPSEINGKPVTTIGGNCFYQHKSLHTIALPETLSCIEGGAFYRCYSLKEVSISKNVTDIGEDTFFRCSSLTDIHVDPQNPHYCDEDGVLYNKDKTVLLSYPEGRTQESYTIPPSVKKIESTVFGYHPKLKELVISSNVVEFPDYNMFIYPDDIRLVVESGSAAESYAKKHELQYTVKQ